MKEHIPCTVHPLFKDKLCYSLSKTGVLFRVLLEMSLQEYGLLPPQAGILHILNSHEEYNQLVLGQEMSIDKASIVKYVDGLEKLGMVLRKTDPNDRRAKILQLTAKGKKVQKEISHLHKKLEDKIMKDIAPKDVELLRRLLPEVLAAVLNELNSVKNS